MKTIFRIVAVVWLLVIGLIGIGGTWLQHNPTVVMPYVFGVASIDPKAGVADQAAQFAGGVGAGMAAAKAMNDPAGWEERARQAEDAREAQRRATAAGWGAGQSLPESAARERTD